MHPLDIARRGELEIIGRRRGTVRQRRRLSVE
jgi:hypothetical protein